MCKIIKDVKTQNKAVHADNNKANKVDIWWKISDKARPIEPLPVQPAVETTNLMVIRN